ncbi:hypothetical protein H7849_21745 [Alloacidobacterium dinghuense]|uniref:Histidine kinase/HSP90-like ATPase domain-containing protein n=1 Tax=Alloacidobacterium dinghuense TaxID=2763107 RepID=A0A7G8BGI4_9BACT|nr:ATP-binding protein [Alloacidobacterium dinghuense]QNI31654.1 hypothetical protein H7849_21745 [Alloacidobacterium dinghuense]
MNLEPWYRSPEVLAAIAVFIVIVVLLIYLLRQKHSISRFDGLLDHRLAHQTRHTRDLNDSFLQTVETGKLLDDDGPSNYDNVADMRRTLKRFSEWLGQATEVRKPALDSLRSPTEHCNDLLEAIPRTNEEGTATKSIEVTFALVGEVQETHSIVSNEIFCIGCEAIQNAYMHSKATNLRVELEFGQDLSLCIIDNGIGIDLTPLKQGDQTQSGLRRMREAASRIGGQLTISSSASLGTQVRVRLGSIIFRKGAGQ